MRSSRRWPTATPALRKPSTPARPARCSTAGSRSAAAWPPPCRPARRSDLGAQAEGEGGLQVVPAVRAERDVGLGVRHAGDLVQPARYDVGEFLVRPDPDHRHHVELAGDRVDLADLGDLGDHLGDLGNALDLCPHQNDRGDHRMPPRLSRPDCAALQIALPDRPARSRCPVERAGAYATTSGQALSCFSVRMPRCASLRISQPSTSAVARASASARWLGAVRAPKNPASVPSLQSGTSSGSITRLASMTVSSTVKPGQASPQSLHPATRKPRSNGALCATSTHPVAKSSSPGSTALSRGAAASIQSVIPVRSAMLGGTGTPGLTSEANSPCRTNSARREPPAFRSPFTRTAPISVIAAAPGDHPVVSRSTTANSRRPSSTSPSPSSPAPACPAPACPAPASGPRAGGAPPHPPGTRVITSGMITLTTVKPPSDISPPPR